MPSQDAESSKNEINMDGKNEVNLSAFANGNKVVCPPLTVTFVEVCLSR